MIVVNVKLETNPGAVAALKAAIATMEKASRAEPGCIDYVFATEINDPTTHSDRRTLGEPGCVEGPLRAAAHGRVQRSDQEKSAEEHGGEDVRREGIAVSAEMRSFRGRSQEEQARWHT